MADEGCEEFAVLAAAQFPRVLLKIAEGVPMAVTECGRDSAASTEEVVPPAPPAVQAEAVREHRKEVELKPEAADIQAVPAGAMLAQGQRVLILGLVWPADLN